MAIVALRSSSTAAWEYEAKLQEERLSTGKCAHKAPALSAAARLFVVEKKRTRIRSFIRVGLFRAPQ